MAQPAATKLIPTPDLVAAFDALAPPSSADGAHYLFSATPVSAKSRHRIGKDPQGAPSLLIAVAGDGPDAVPPPIALEHLSVQHQVVCRVTLPDRSVQEGRFTVLRCGGNDRVLVRHFLHVAQAIVGSLSNEPTDSEVRRAVEGLVELFRAMGLPPRKSVQGLWAELFLIARLREPRHLATAWHTLPGDLFDFNAAGQRIEVKSASGRVRQHHFMLEQLRPTVGSQSLIASILVDRAGAGASLADLLGDIRPRLREEPGLMLHLELVAAQTLGDSWRRALDERFDRQAAEASLEFFEAHSLPSVDPVLPRGVSEVKFRVDLTGLPSADLARYRAFGGIFAAALKR